LARGAWLLQEFPKHNRRCSLPFLVYNNTCVLLDHHYASFRSVKREFVSLKTNFKSNYRPLKFHNLWNVNNFKLADHNIVQILMLLSIATWLWFRAFVEPLHTPSFDKHGGKSIAHAWPCKHKCT
jgi:hypothetical protein